MPDLTPVQVAGYAASALRITAELEWPADARGSASKFVIQDLAEFAEAIIACARADYWSPALALERLWIERLEVLLGATANPRFAKRYVESGTQAPDLTAPLKPRRKARPEDAISAAGSALGADQEWVTGLRDALTAIKATSSDWFVHPTSLGPLTSFNMKSGADSAGSWGNLVAMFGVGCIFAILAAQKSNLTVPVDLILAVKGAATIHERLQTPSATGLRAMYDHLAAQLMR